MSLLSILQGKSAGVGETDQTARPQTASGSGTSILGELQTRLVEKDVASSGNLQPGLPQQLAVDWSGRVNSNARPRQNNETEPLASSGDWTRKMPIHVKVLGLRPGAARSAAAQDEAEYLNNPVTATAVVIATLEFESVNGVHFLSTTTLAQVRTKLEQTLGQPSSFKFCTDEGAVLDEEIILHRYISQCKYRPESIETFFHIFLLPVDGPKEMQSSLLAKPPYIIKFFRLSPDGQEPTSEGTLQYSAFQGRDPSSMRMLQFRKLIESMSRDQRTDEFCLRDRTAVQDALTFKEYLSLIPREFSKDAGVPGISVYFRKAGSVKLAPPANPRSGVYGRPVSGNPRSAASSGPAPSKWGSANAEVKGMMQNFSKDLSHRDLSGTELQRDKEGLKVQEQLTASQFAVSEANLLKYAAEMDERDWDMVLTNCNVMYGWRIDREKNLIVRAPKPAFRLREGLNMTYAEMSRLEQDDIADKQKLAEARMALQTKPKAEDEEHKSISSSSSAVLTPSTTNPDTSSLPEALPNATSSEPTPAEIDNKSRVSSIEEAEKLAAAMEKFDPAEKVEVKKTTPVVRPPLGNIVKAEDVRVYRRPKPSARPTFTVNDGSKIEISVVEHEFSQSMAENHFSADTLNASASGSYSGVSFGVSAGMSKESQTSHSTSSKSYSKTMVASYKFPRVTVQLYPEDLVPTDELKDAIMLIKRNKNINDLRKLHDTFGHLFVHDVTLGGALQTSKIVTSTQIASENKERQKFKMNVGAAVSVPGGPGGSVEATHEEQDSIDSGQSQKDTREALSFEATGGNTILATDPIAWSKSVADFRNWRVVNQSDLSLLADAISRINGFAEVQTWFLQAVPKLSEYLVIPPSRRIDVRFKAMVERGSPLDTIFQNQVTYIGHDPAQPPKYLKTAIEVSSTFSSEAGKMHLVNGRPVQDITHFTTQVKITTEDTIFYPGSTQAPTLMSIPVDKTIEKVKDSLLKTAWRIEAPYGFNLGHGSLVLVKSLVTPNKSLSMTVYRNQQGVFLPAISDTQDPCFWRIYKNGSHATESPIKEGDTIRLGWCFSDQTSGFRDYMDDVYGRRRFNKPSGIFDEILYLKVPYPRIENVGDSAGISMVLSASDSPQPVEELWNILPRNSSQATRYRLYDLSFRLDSAGNNGLGDSRDYMNFDVDAYRRIMTTDKIQSGSEQKQQGLGDIAQAAAGQVGNSVGKFFTGSPEDVALRCVKTAALGVISPGLALVSIFL